MNRSPRPGWHNVARRAFFWSDTVEPYTERDQALDLIRDEIARVTTRLNALVSIVEMLIAVSPLKDVNHPDRPFAKWRKMADGR